MAIRFPPRLHATLIILSVRSDVVNHFLPARPLPRLPDVAPEDFLAQAALLRRVLSTSAPLKNAISKTIKWRLWWMAVNGSQTGYSTDGKPWSGNVLCQDLTPSAAGPIEVREI